MKKIAADRNYRLRKRAETTEDPDLSALITGLGALGWTVTKTFHGMTASTLARCTDGTDNCNKKSFSAELSGKKGQSIGTKDVAAPRRSV